MTQAIIADPQPLTQLEIDRKVFELYDEYCHGGMDRRAFLARAAVAVMGGLMEDRVNYNTNEIPGLGGIPVLGNFFSNRNDTTTKTELVIFLKPTIIRDPSINGDYRSFRDQLPSREFFSSNPGPGQKQIETQGAGAR